MMTGSAFRGARSACSVVRKAKNRLLNLIEGPVVILIYHRVTTLPADPQMLAVTPSNFRAHLKFLKENYRVVRFEEDWKEAVKPAVAITFDDGYADNFLEALPLLEEAGMPATFFVSTGNLGTRREFWWDELDRIVLGDLAFPERFTLKDGRVGRSWPTTSGHDRQRLYREIHSLMKKVDAQTRDGWMTQLRQWARAEDEGREAYRSMTVDELRQLAGSGLATIGAHTVTHTPFSSLTIAAQRGEITESRRRLESWLEREVTVFSYPFGARNDYTRESRRLCRQAGFVKAAANFPGQARRWTDPYQLPRQLVRNWELDVFAAAMRGFLV